MGFYPRLVRALKPASGVVKAVLFSRRQLNLPRWTRGPAFADLHRVVVAWLDVHLTAVEQNIPWLRRVGTEVSDSCQGFVYSAFDVSLTPRFHASAGCTRDVFVVYGFDGDLPERLERLGEALSAAGWERRGPLPLRAWADSDETALLSWRPNALVGYPPDLEAKPPWGRSTLSPTMWLSWCSRGQTTRLHQEPHPTRSDNRNYLSVESRGTEHWKLPDIALSQHEHAMTVHIQLGYYSNPDALGRRHRIPRYLRPTQPTR